MRWTAVSARLLGALVVLASVVGLGTVRAAAEEVSVRIGDGLDPKELTVAPGTTVRWTNADGERHRVRSNGGPVSFDSGNLEPGQSFTVTFSASGRSTYVDDRDRDDAAYHGAVTVTGSSAPAPAPAPGSSSPSPAAPPPSSVTITMANRAFSPSSVVLAPGATVTWANRDDRAHTGTADDSSFDTGDLAPGASATTTHAREGTFTFRCDLHPEMTGAIRVASAAAEPAPTPAPAPAPAPSAPSPAPAPSEPTPPATPAPSGSAAAGPVTRNVQIGDLFFAPATLDLRVGDTVVWTNAGRAPHTVTAASFDSGRLAAGATFRWTASAAGTVPYGCTIHPEMTGRLRVVAAAAASPAVAATTPTTTITTAPTATTSTSAPAPTDATATPAGVEVEVVDVAFEPEAARVEVGGTVTWRFTGAAPHSVTAGDGAFDSGVVDQGATFSHAFSTEGTFAYSCLVHPTMQGTVEVVPLGEVTPVAATSERRPSGDGHGNGNGSGDTQAWVVALLGGAGILGATGLLLGGARRFLLAAGS